MPFPLDDVAPVDRTKPETRIYLGQRQLIEAMTLIGTYSLIFYVAGSVYLIALAIMHWLVPRLEQAEVC